MLLYTISAYRIYTCTHSATPNIEGVLFFYLKDGKKIPLNMTCSRFVFKHPCAYIEKEIHYRGKKSKCMKVKIDEIFTWDTQTSKKKVLRHDEIERRFWASIMNSFQVYATYEYDYDRYKVVPICVFFLSLYHFSVCTHFYLLHLCDTREKKKNTPPPPSLSTLCCHNYQYLIHILTETWAVLTLKPDEIKKPSSAQCRHTVCCSALSHF